MAVFVIKTTGLCMCEPQENIPRATIYRQITVESRYLEIHGTVAQFRVKGSNNELLYINLYQLCQVNLATDCNGTRTIQVIIFADYVDSCHEPQV